MMFNRIKLYNILGILTLLYLVLMQKTHAETQMLPKANLNNLKVYVREIVGRPEIYRNHKNVVELNRVAAWIKEQMKQFGIPCHYQSYSVNRQTYKNIVCSLNVGYPYRTIVGAHYDVYGEQEGADDNASGIAGVLETARLLALQKSKLQQNIEFVFYTLEEPPYFRTENMGSYIHAKSVSKNKQSISGVYILEMIGYYSTKEIQQYPVGLGILYPRNANFIAAISNFSSRQLSAQFCDSMRDLNQLPCERFIGPAFIHGIDFSDHGNYWDMEIPAIMITDTAFYRNPYYHTENDRVATLNFHKMANVINGLTQTLLK